MWTPVLTGRSGPRYKAIADALAEDVARGQLPPGARLPPHRELAVRLGVTVGTVSRAYAELQRIGLLEGQIGRGSFVRNTRIPGGHLADGEALRRGIIDLSLNYPPSSPLEAAPIADAFAALARDPCIAEFIGYPPEEGHHGHVAAARAWLAQGGIRAPAERIVVTAGVQHALAAALAAICEPHDTVLAEALSYPGIQGLAIMQHLQLRGVSMDDSGMRPDAFEAACRSRRVRAVYTIPNLHNPTCITMTEERRRAIAAIARQYEVLVIEDDIYGFMLPEVPAPILDAAPEHTIYITGTSKNLAPGLRVGFAVAPARLVPRIAAMVRATMWMPAPPMVEVFRLLVESGEASRLVEMRHSEAAARQRLAAEALRGFVFRADRHAPHLWLRLPGAWVGRNFTDEARLRGVSVLTSETFALRPEAETDHVRLCIGQPPDRAILSRGLSILCGLLREKPGQQWRYF
jgi:DNA-binding transcriptional MocR family regulator